MSLPRYPAYQHSKLEWVQILPEHWTARRLKRNVRLLTEKTDTREYPVGLENLEGWTGRFIQTESDFQGEGVGFEADDILFGKLRPYLAKAWLADRSGEAIGDFHVLRPFEGAIPRFIQYQLLTREVIDLVDGSTYGAKMPRASWGFLGCLELPTPPAKEQLAIASFLDRETAKIDALIAEQQRLIELLQEKRQAVISHAVTKGLNPNAPMKDSGVEWLGEVPEHWIVSRLGRYAKAKGGAGFPDEHQGNTENDIPFLKVANLGSNHSRNQTEGYQHSVTEETARKLGAEVFPCGTVVFAKVGAALLLERYKRLEQDSCLDNNMMALRNDEKAIDNEYLRLSLSTIRLARVVNPGAVPSINASQVHSFTLAIPPIEEQAEICFYLTSALKGIDHLHDEVQQAIALLQERRSALISAAVTGQIDVRGLATEEEP